MVTFPSATGKIPMFILYFIFISLDNQTADRYLLPHSLKRLLVVVFTHVVWVGGVKNLDHISKTIKCKDIHIG